MKDLAKYRFGKIGSGSAVHILLESKSLCNSKDGVEDPDLGVKDVTCKRCINPMYKYKPYHDLMAQEEKTAKKKQSKAKGSDTQKPKEEKQT